MRYAKHFHLILTPEAQITNAADEKKYDFAFFLFINHMTCQAQFSLRNNDKHSGMSSAKFCVVLNSLGAKFQTTFVVCFFYFNKLPLGKIIICKIERLNIKQHRSR